jgi:hypothetical protein
MINSPYDIDDDENYRNYGLHIIDEIVYNYSHHNIDFVLEKCKLCLIKSNDNNIQSFDFYRNWIIYSYDRLRKYLRDEYDKLKVSNPKIELFYKNVVGNSNSIWISKETILRYFNNVHELYEYCNIEHYMIGEMKRSRHLLTSGHRPELFNILKLTKL